LNAEYPDNTTRDFLFRPTQAESRVLTMHPGGATSRYGGREGVLLRNRIKLARIRTTGSTIGAKKSRERHEKRRSSQNEIFNLADEEEGCRS